MDPRNRRRFLALSAAGLMVPGRLAAATPTPQATEGPFYPTRRMRFRDIDNDLVKLTGAVQQAGGDIITLTGRVLDRDGQPLRGARVEIWQVDMNGRYLHTGDRQAKPRDVGFQGFGHFVTSDDGVYTFRTIKPVRYPGRTPHIHVKVMAGPRTLTTQFYIAGEPGNRSDGLYARMSRAEQEAVEMQFQSRGGVETAVLDIVL